MPSKPRGFLRKTSFRLPTPRRGHLRRLVLRRRRPCATPPNDDRRRSPNRRSTASSFGASAEAAAAKAAAARGLRDPRLQIRPRRDPRLQIPRRDNDRAEAPLLAETPPVKPPGACLGRPRRGDATRRRGGLAERSRRRPRRRTLPDHLPRDVAAAPAALWVGLGAAEASPPRRRRSGIIGSRDRIRRRRRSPFAAAPGAFRRGNLSPASPRRPPRARARAARRAASFAFASLRTASLASRATRDTLPTCIPPGTRRGTRSTLASRDPRDRPGHGATYPSRPGRSAP